MLYIASTIEILKLQETPKQYTSVYDQYKLNTRTSGWSVCKQYAASFWIKKVSWTSDWESYARITSDTST